MYLTSLSPQETEIILLLQVIPWTVVFFPLFTASRVLQNLYTIVTPIYNIEFAIYRQCGAVALFLVYDRAVLNIRMSGYSIDYEKSKYYFPI